jgi:hypothetical protein
MLIAVPEAQAAERLNACCRSCEAAQQKNAVIKTPDNFFVTVDA